MRWLFLAVVPFLAGCLGEADFGEQEMDCSEDNQSVAGGHREVLYPAGTPARPVGGPVKATVTAREGQTVAAYVSYSNLGGQVRVLFDGPHDNTVATGNTWTWQGKVNAGDYTLELEGDPMAFEVRYNLILIATGCTPV